MKKIKGLERILEIDALEIQAMADYGNGLEPRMDKDDPEFTWFTVFGHKTGEGLILDIYQSEEVDKARFFAEILRDWLEKEAGKPIIIRDFSGEEE